MAYLSPTIQTVTLAIGTPGTFVFSQRLRCGGASALVGKLYRPAATTMLATGTTAIGTALCTVASNATLKVGMSVTVSSGGIAGTANTASYIVSLSGTTQFTIANNVATTQVSVNDVFTFNGSQDTGVHFALTNPSLMWSDVDAVAEAPATPTLVLPTTLVVEPVVTPAGSLIMVWPRPSGALTTIDNCFPTGFMLHPGMSCTVAGFYGFIDWASINAGRT